MIARITGTLSFIGKGFVIIETSGIGYKVFVRGNAVFSPESHTCLFTHLAVRENALDLYGFLREQELTLFESLIKIPKIGPKTALQILTQAEDNVIVRAAKDNDPPYLSKMSGMGKKTAEKIVTGLKDITIELEEGSNEPEIPDDAIDALIALGYDEKTARDTLRDVPKEFTTTQERLKYAFRMLNSQ